MKQTFKESQPLSSDLEWMLTSNQVSITLLAESLVEAYYSPIYRLALCILDHEEEAQKASVQVLRSVLADKDRYNSAMSLDLWIYRQALEICLIRLGWLKFWQKFQPSVIREIIHFRTAAPDNQAEAALWLAVDSLDEKERIPFLLEKVQGWKTEFIARLLGETEAEIQSRLESAEIRLSFYINWSKLFSVTLEREQRRDWVRRSLEKRWPAPQFTPEQLQIVQKDSTWQTVRQQRLFKRQEIFWVLAIALLAAGIFWGNSQLDFESKPAKSPALIQTAARMQRSTPAVASQKRMAQISPTETTTPVPLLMGHYTVKRGDTLDGIAAQLGIPLEDLAVQNGITQGKSIRPGDILAVPSLPYGRQDFTPTPVRTESLRLGPFNRQSAPENIVQSLLLSDTQWKTLWVNAKIVLYGPQGYSGPPLALRDQLWISQPGQSKELLGPLGGSPYYQQVTVNGHRVYQDRYSDGVGLEQTGELARLPQLNGLIFPEKQTELRLPGKFRISGTDRIAGRETVVVDHLNNSGELSLRLWLDTLTGIILREQQYGGLNNRFLEEDITVTSIALDVNFPARLFDPNAGWEGGFSVDSQGNRSYNEPELYLPEMLAVARHPLPIKPAPMGFDASHNSLVFQYSQAPALDFPHTAMLPVVNLFSGGYFLTSLEFNSRWDLRCDRSSDGKRVAFAPDVHWPGFSEELAPPPLIWVDLSYPPAVHIPHPDIQVFDLAFAPDSHRLALFGTNNTLASFENKVYIYDSDRGELSPLLDISKADSLVWSPDGKSLALVGTQAEWDTPEVLVVRISDGKIIYSLPVDPGIFSQTPAELGTNWPAPDWLGRNWGVRFPVWERDLVSCAVPLH